MFIPHSYHFFVYIFLFIYFSNVTDTHCRILLTLYRLSKYLHRHILFIFISLVHCTRGTPQTYVLARARDTFIILKWELVYLYKKKMFTIYIFIILIYFIYIVFWLIVWKMRWPINIVCCEYSMSLFIS